MTQRSFPAPLKDEAMNDEAPFMAPYCESKLDVKEPTADQNENQMLNERQTTMRNDMASTSFFIKALEDEQSIMRGHEMATVFVQFGLSPLRARISPKPTRSSA